MQSKSVDWSLYDKGLHHETVKKLIFFHCIDRIRGFYYKTTCTLINLFEVMAVE